MMRQQTGTVVICCLKAKRSDVFLKIKKQAVLEHACSFITL